MRIIGRDGVSKCNPQCEGCRSVRLERTEFDASRILHRSFALCTAREAEDVLSEGFGWKGAEVEFDFSRQTRFQCGGQIESNDDCPPVICWLWAFAKGRLIDVRFGSR